MKKLLALLLAASMVLTLTACGEEDDKKDSSKNNNSSSQEDNSTDSESKDDESKDEDSKDEDSKDDSSTPEGMQTIKVDGFTMDVPDTWKSQTTNSLVYYMATDAGTTGNNLNIISTLKDSGFKSYTADMFANQLKTMYPDYDVSIGGFEYITIDDCDAFEMIYNIKIQNILTVIHQYYIDGSDKTYIITFTGNTGEFEDLSVYTDTINVD